MPIHARHVRCLRIFGAGEMRKTKRGRKERRSEGMRLWVQVGGEGEGYSDSGKSKHLCVRGVLVVTGPILVFLEWWVG